MKAVQPAVEPLAEDPVGVELTPGIESRLLRALAPRGHWPRAIPVARLGLDFAAAAPFSYDHSTGGGAWMNKDKAYVVESLESGDFLCGDTVSFLTAITVGAGADTRAHDGGSSPTSSSWTARASRALRSGPVTFAGVTGANGHRQRRRLGQQGRPAMDSDRPGWVTPDYFIPGEVNTLAVSVDDLEFGEQVILRIDTTISCMFQGEPTGNLQAWISEAEVTTPTNGGTVNVGNETVPFKADTDLVTYGRLVVDKVTDPRGAAAAFPFRVSAPGVLVEPYSQAFQLTDAAAPWASGDIYPVGCRDRQSPRADRRRLHDRGVTPLPRGGRSTR